MVTVSVRKLEVVHKQVEGYLIPYNRQLAFVRKVEGYFTRCVYCHIDRSEFENKKLILLFCLVVS